MKLIEPSWLNSLPWPQIWTAMSWEIAHQVTSLPEIVGIKIQWNETLLAQQVDSKSFIKLTDPMRIALKNILHDGLEWEVKLTKLDTPHSLIVVLEK